MLEKYRCLKKNFEDFEEEMLQKWIDGVERKIEVNLNKTLITRNPSKTILILNFHPEVSFSYWNFMNLI